MILHILIPIYDKVTFITCKSIFNRRVYTFIISAKRFFIIEAIYRLWTRNSELAFVELSPSSSPRKVELIPFFLVMKFLYTVLWRHLGHSNYWNQCFGHYFLPLHYQIKLDRPKVIIKYFIYDEVNDLNIPECSWYFRYQYWHFTRDI